ncbi:ATP synthase F0 subunit B [Sporolactobacillus sp. THM7-7]|nr:ATP synthase F0 subunit B [Sporolactobacillus sp. THM7-7]
MSFSLGTILAQLIIFLILMALISWVGVKPVVEIMNKRKQYISGEIDAAEKSRKESAEYLAKQKEALDKVREESRDIIEQAKKQAQNEAQSIIDDAKTRSERLIKEAHEEINREKDKAVAALRDEVADLSVLLASRMLEKEINPKDYSKEIDELMKQVGNQR